MGRVFKPLQSGGMQVSKFEPMPESCSADYYCATNNIERVAAMDLKVNPQLTPGFDT